MCTLYLLFCILYTQCFVYFVLPVMCIYVYFALSIMCTLYYLLCTFVVCVIVLCVSVHLLCNADVLSGAALVYF